MLANHRWLSPILFLALVVFVIFLGLSTRANEKRERAGKMPAYQLAGRMPAHQLAGKMPAYQLAGRMPAHQLADKVPAYQLADKMPAYQLADKMPAYQLAGKMPAYHTSDPKLVDGLAAWQQVYSVLTSPRCINCHTATNYPQQGDDRHRHFANVIRGPAGRGVPALSCIGCHQEVNADSTGVPGGPDWHLAPLSMRWQDTNDRPLSSAAVCRAVTDKSKNENMDGRALLTHHEEAALVLWAWKPGRRPDGTERSVPPLTHAEFVNATRTWVEAGTPCPRGK